MHDIDVINQKNEKAWILRETDPALAKILANEALDMSYGISYIKGQAFSLLIISACSNIQGHHRDTITFAERAEANMEYLEDWYKPYTNLLLGIANRNLQNISEAQYFLRKAAVAGESYNNPGGVAAAQDNLGHIYRALGDHATALEHYLLSLRHWKAIHHSQRISLLLNHIAGIHEKEENYEEALLHYEESAVLKRALNDQRGIAHVLNNIAIIYGKQQNFLKAHLNYTEALKIYEELNFKEGIAFTRSNIADAYIHSGEPLQAVPHLLKAIEIFRAINNATHLAIALTNLALAHSGAGELLKAQELLPEIETLLKTIEAKAVSVEIHRDLSHVCEIVGNIQQALLHCREFHRIDKEIFNEESDKRLKNIQIIHQVEQMKKDKEKAEIKAEKLKQENDFKAKELTTLALHLVQKNNLINNIQEEVKKTLSTLDDAKRILLKNVLRAIRDANLQESDWQQFEEQFLKVHGEFLHTLSQRHPDLSSAELKVCALLKLQLSNKQVATLLNISLRTVEFHRLNIRKKLALPEKGNLISYLQNL